MPPAARAPSSPRALAGTCGAGRGGAGGAARAMARTLGQQRRQRRWRSTMAAVARTCVPALLLAGAGAAAAVAAEHLVHLRTESPAGRFRFDPAVVLARPGDEIRFVPDARTYGVRSIAGMQPEGTPRFSGRMGEEIVIHVDAPG